MKKITRILLATITMLSIGLAPAVVHAQIGAVEEVGGPSALPQTGGTDVQAPDTGIAPSNRVAQNAAVFIGGSLLGAGIGFGVITLKKKRQE